MKEASCISQVFKTFWGSGEFGFYNTKRLTHFGPQGLEQPFSIIVRPCSQTHQWWFRARGDPLPQDPAWRSLKCNFHGKNRFQTQLFRWISEGGSPCSTKCISYNTFGLVLAWFHLVPAASKCKLKEAFSDLLTFKLLEIQFLSVEWRRP